MLDRFLAILAVVEAGKGWRDGGRGSDGNRPSGRLRHLEWRKRRSLERDGVRGRPSRGVVDAGWGLVQSCCS